MLIGWLLSQTLDLRGLTQRLSIFSNLKPKNLCTLACYGRKYLVDGLVY